ALQQTVLFPGIDAEDPSEEHGGPDMPEEPYGSGAEDPADGAEGHSAHSGASESHHSEVGAVRYRAGADVRHPERGHGWVQGSGHGVVTVRFETRTSGLGHVVSFDANDPALCAADPLDSLDWPAEWTRPGGSGAARAVSGVAED